MNTESKKNKKLIRLAMYIVIALLAMCAAWYGHTKYVSTDSYKAKQIENESKALEKEAKDLVSQVSKLMLLPDETPAIFNIQDPEKLVSQQLFFKGAQKDDKLMVFQKAGKAVLYSPSRGRIINVGPITFDQPAASNPALQTETKVDTKKVETKKK